jgi:hypothetical protein
MKRLLEKEINVNKNNKSKNAINNNLTTPKSSMSPQIINLVENLPSTHSSTVDNSPIETREKNNSQEMTENTEKENFGKLSIDDKLDFMFAELLSVKQQMNNRNVNNNQFNHKPNVIRSDRNSNRRYANHQRSYRKNSNNNFNGNKKFNN